MPPTRLLASVSITRGRIDGIKQQAKTRQSVLPQAPRVSKKTSPLRLVQET